MRICEEHAFHFGIQASKEKNSRYHTKTQLQTWASCFLLTKPHPSKGQPIEGVTAYSIKPNLTHHPCAIHPDVHRAMTPAKAAATPAPIMPTMLPIAAPVSLGPELALAPVAPPDPDLVVDAVVPFSPRIAWLTSL